MTSLIVYSLKKKRANNVCLLVPAIPNEGKWSDVEDFLHILTADYDFECFQQSPPSQITTNWILFQVGIFDIEMIQFDISTVTSTF
ncbi:hypothetical protein GLOIN_2v1800921 [Rhizophagus irregularis DAOM 181602=DAOM 197198]|nr:hypothetical protein GLOIN_2v1800921 [Rhizophagus irregularis DAOM 181602=DAOM 197198]